jgi:hypothetical protein
MRYDSVGQSVAQDTLLGWIIFGPTGTLKADEQHSAPTFHKTKQNMI